MQIQGMTIEELKNRVEIGMVELDKQDVWELLKFAVTTEVKLDYFSELEDENKNLKKQIEKQEEVLEQSFLESSKQTDRIYELENIIESALDMIKNPELYEEDVDKLIDLLKGGLK